MNRFMYKTASKFIKKDLKNKVDFKTVSTYLQGIGFSVIPYNCNRDNEILTKYNVLEFSKTVKGFTIYRRDFKAVFIDDTVPCSEKLCVLLHEAAHIILGHIDKKDIQDSRICEMEADAFAYLVLHPRERNLYKILTVCMSALLCVLLIIQFTPRAESPTVAEYTAPEKEEEYIVQNTEAPPEPAEERVLITPTGTKFHRPDCRYVKNKRYKTLPRPEALKKYAPCSVCEP